MRLGKKNTQPNALTLQIMMINDYTTKVWSFFAIKSNIRYNDFKNFKKKLKGENMELLYEGDLLNEFFKLTPEEKMYLANLGYQWCNSRNISAYKIVGNDTIFRLHNGSLYKFNNSKEWSEKNLSSTIRKDVFGLLIRKKTNYEFVGVLFMDDDCNETDFELLYKYIPDDMVEKTKNKDTYNIREIEEEIIFYGPCDDSIINHRFQLTARVGKPIFLIGLGEIEVIEILEASWSQWMKVKVKLNNETLNAIRFTREVYGEKVPIAFTNPKKIL